MFIRKDPMAGALCVHARPATDVGCVAPVPSVVVARDDEVVTRQDSTLLRKLALLLEVEVVRQVWNVKMNAMELTRT